MWKSILAGTAALAIAGTSFVYAQQRSDDGPARWRLSQEDRAAFTDARIAALKAGLRLTPDQEKNWPTFEAALRDIAKSRMDHRAERNDEPRTGDRTDGAGLLGSAERLRRHAEMMMTAGANLKKLADAQEPLYQKSRRQPEEALPDPCERADRTQQALRADAQASATRDARRGPPA